MLIATTSREATGTMAGLVEKRTMFRGGACVTGWRPRQGRSLTWQQGVFYPASQKETPPIYIVIYAEGIRKHKERELNTLGKINNYGHLWKTYVYACTCVAYVFGTEIYVCLRVWVCMWRDEQYWVTPIAFGLVSMRNIIVNSNHIGNELYNKSPWLCEWWPSYLELNTSWT